MSKFFVRHSLFHTRVPWLSQTGCKAESVTQTHELFESDVEERRV